MILVALIALPLLGALVTWLVGRRRPSSARWWALGSAGLAAIATAVAAGGVGPGAPLAYRADVLGFPALSLWLDGLSLPLVALTAFLGVVAVLAGWKVEDRPGTFFGLLLTLQAAVTAVFLAADLILFYAAWEAVLIPMFFLIGRWGHERRQHAAMKFFIYTFAGSALMLVGIIVIWTATGSTAFMRALSPEIGRGLTGSARVLVFWLLAAGFAVKVPVFPLHTWLPDAHVEAPTAGSIMLAGVLLKMGGYGFLRIGLPVAPEAARAAAPVLATLGIVAIVYGALMALAQTDLKRLVAYSSVAHMGFVVTAIAIGTPAALGAALLGMVAHGVTAALLFLLVGLLYERAHTREMSAFGGLAARIPGWAAVFVFACLASAGLPGLAGFPGELVTTLESFKSWGWWTAPVLVGVVLAGAYNLRAVRSVVQGPVGDDVPVMGDLDARESLAVAPLVVAVTLLGLVPALVSGPATEVLTNIARALGRG